MKPLTRILLSLLFAICSLQALPAPKSVYLLRLDDEIGSTTWRHTRRALDAAADIKADLLVVHLNTYGGEVVFADSIRTALLNTPIPVVAWVDNNAASAGALIALACDSVWMRPGASMGAATVVNGTDGAAMPDKYQSYMRAMMRSTAQHHGKIDGRWRRHPLIAEAMVDSRVVVPGLIDSTKVLTFTPDEAIRWGYADGKAESLDEVLSSLDIKEYRIEEFRPDWLDSLIGFFTSSAVRAILIMIIVGGIYMELHTPGLGFPAAASIIAAILYFLPLYITGIAAPWLVLLFIGGVLLLILEVFVVPGFGVTGIAGICCIAASLLLALFDSVLFSSPGGSLPSMSAVARALAIFTSGTVMAAAAMIWLSSSRGPRWFRRRAGLQKEQLVSEGYIGVDMTMAHCVGRQGVTFTDMRPSGKVTVDSRIYDAVSEVGFIPAGTQVNVTRFLNAQIYVTPIDYPSQP